MRLSVLVLLLLAGSMSAIEVAIFDMGKAVDDDKQSRWFGVGINVMGFGGINVTTADFFELEPTVDINNSYAYAGGGALSLEYVDNYAVVSFAYEFDRPWQRFSLSDAANGSQPVAYSMRVNRHYVGLKGMFLFFWQTYGLALGFQVGIFNMQPVSASASQNGVSVDRSAFVASNAFGIRFRAEMAYSFKFGLRVGLSAAIDAAFSTFNHYRSANEKSKIDSNVYYMFLETRLLNF